MKGMKAFQICMVNDGIAEGRNDQMDWKDMEPTADLEWERQALAKVAHELRTPVHGILGIARQGLETEDPAVKDAALGQIIQAGEHLAQLVGDVLALAKVQSGTWPCQEEAYDPRKLAEDAAALLRRTAGESEISVTITPGTPGTLLGDGGKLRQILLNLGGNAVKFSPSGKVGILVETVPSQEGVWLTMQVRDTGKGIPPEQLEAMFAPYVQGQAGQGTGLGLAISRELAASMGGTLTAESTPGVGSIFTLSVPQKLAENASSPRKWTAPTVRILIADDTPLNLAAAKGFFAPYDVQLTLCGSGEEALGLATEQDFDLILLDELMPSLTGTQTMKHLRERGITVPILAMTGLEAAPTGFDEVLKKPLNKHALEAALLRWLPAERIKYTKEQ